MKWESKHSADLKWSTPIINREAKEEVAQRIAQLLSDGDVVGVGSGSTSFLAIQAIGRRLQKEAIRCVAIPTSAEISMTCAALEIPVTTLQHSRPDWSFDGADEVDPQCSLIKGRGGALFQEKMLISSSPKNYIIVDSSKMVSQLGMIFPIPVEVHQQAVSLVEERLYSLGATEVNLRLAQRKDGPVITENGNFLLDVRFVSVENTLEREIKSITGVIESGLFIGYGVEVIMAENSAS